MLVTEIVVPPIWERSVPPFPAALVLHGPYGITEQAPLDRPWREPFDESMNSSSFSDWTGSTISHVYVHWSPCLRVIQQQDDRVDQVNMRSRKKTLPNLTHVLLFLGMGVSLVCVQYVDVEITHRPVYQPAYYITVRIPRLFADWYDTLADLADLDTNFLNSPNTDNIHHQVVRAT